MVMVNKMGVGLQYGSHFSLLFYVLDKVGPRGTQGKNESNISPTVAAITMPSVGVTGCNYNPQLWCQ